MALTKETGSIVASANTYAEVSDLDAWCAERNITLTAADDDAKEALLHKAMDYLARYRGQWKGDRVSDDQELDWPRHNVWIDGRLIAYTVIPRELFYAQLTLAVAADSTELMPTQPANAQGRLKRRKIDVIEHEWENTGKVMPVAADAGADALIRVLLKRSGLVAVERI